MVFILNSKALMLYLQRLFAGMRIGLLVGDDKLRISCVSYPFYQSCDDCGQSLSCTGKELELEG